MGYDVFYCERCGHPVVKNASYCNGPQHYKIENGTQVFTAKCRVFSCKCGKAILN